MKRLAIIPLASLVAAPLVGCDDRPSTQAAPTAAAKSGASPAASTTPAPALPGDAELEAARVLLRYEKSRIDGVMPPASWPDPEAVRRLGDRTWVVDVDASRMPSGCPEQLRVEASSADRRTGRPKR